jgi:hypothetical protein
LKKKSTSLAGALAIILACSVVAMAAMIVAGIVTGEWLYYVAAVLFAISGTSGVFVVRSLSSKIRK